ncbi:AAA family ATPase [Natronobeatus ordinarius]|uniref:AAA family ATPase n=1 Tax=Natronobeatus ordinarius TaxID=2963433 RepID=UPI0020CEA75C|nr:AAA family ATPase [Natronobeatus ordinarius]
MIVIVCGPPAVGKTTVSSLLCDRLEEREKTVRRLDSDAFERNTYDRLYERVTSADEDWIVAGTFYKRTWQERFQRLEDGFVVHLVADLETCLERNRQREDAIDEQAVHIVWREFDDPDADLVVDVTEHSPEEATDCIVAALEGRFESG